MVTIGTTSDGNSIRLSDAERSAHVHVIGQTRSGKSKLLEYMIRQDIKDRRGLCLIDPHGFLSDAIERWCCARGLAGTRRIHLVKPGSPGWTAGFNPLRLKPGEAPSVRVAAMASACAQVWGGQDLNQTPRLKRILRATFFALAVRGLTLAEAPSLLNSNDPEGTRRALTKDLPDPMYDFIWGELNKLTRREFAEVVESTISRIASLLDSPALRLMLGQRSNVIDFRQVMDRGEIVLVNLGSRDAFDYENVPVIGALILSDLFLTARGRGEQAAKQRPFTLYMDEAYDYVSTDLERILDQTAKFGLHAVIAHQRLAQLRQRGVYDAVMGSTRTKIAFNLADEDADVMAGELFRDQFDPNRPKHILDKPVVVDQRLVRFASGGSSRTESSSEAETETLGWAEADVVSSSTSESAFENAGEGFLPLADNPSEPVSLSTSVGASRGAASGVARSTSTSGSTGRIRGRGQAWTESEGWHEAMVDVREWLPTATYSLEEQHHAAHVGLRQLPQAYAVIKPMGSPATVVRIPRIGPILSSDRMIERFRERVCCSSPFLSTTSAAEIEMRERQAELITVALPTAEEQDVEFWPKD